MGITCGTDIIEIKRIEESIGRSENSFIKRVFTEEEIKYCESKKINRMKSYAARFAAKEAVVKALGTGISDGINFIDIEVRNRTGGSPYVILRNRAKEVADEMGIGEISISLSHCQEYAIAYVVAEMTKK